MHMDPRVVVEEAGTLACKYSKFNYKAGQEGHVVEKRLHDMIMMV